MTQDYYGTKRITAWEQEKDGKPGYAVKYEDGYISWSPMEAFEKAYQPLDALSFGHAIVALEAGHKVARAGWNGNGMWLTLAGENWSVSFHHHGARKPVDFAGYCPFITMFTADKRYVPWLASQTDMLAKDWQIVE